MKSLLAQELRKCVTVWKSFECPSFLKPNTLLCPRWCMEVRNGFLGQSDSVVKVQAQVFTSPFPLLLCMPEDFMFYPSGCGRMSQTHSPVHWCCTNLVSMQHLCTFLSWEGVWKSHRNEVETPLASTSPLLFLFGLGALPLMFASRLGAAEAWD